MAVIAALAWTATPALRSMWHATTLSPEKVTAKERSVYYRNCDHARGAGAAPIYKGQPGYREGIDGDGDGVACEPYR